MMGCKFAFELGRREEAASTGAAEADDERGELSNGNKTSCWAKKHGGNRPAPDS